MPTYKTRLINSPSAIGAEAEEFIIDARRALPYENHIRNRITGELLWERYHRQPVDIQLAVIRLLLDDQEYAECIQLDGKNRRV